MNRRKYGMGCLFRRPDSRWWWIKYRHNGKTEYESTKTESRAEAMTMLRKRVNELSSGQPAPVIIERMAFDAIEQALIDDYRANGRKSLERAEYSLKALKDYFGSWRLVEISFDKLNSFIAHRLELGKKPAMVRNELAALKRGFRLLERAGKAKTPPFPTITVQNVRSGFFEEAQVEQVIARLPEDLKPLIRFLALTGWRVGEARSLRWSQVDFESGTVRLDPGATKNREGRVFPFAALPPLLYLLREQKARTEGLERLHGQIIPHVFFWSDVPVGRPIADFRESWKKACEALGLVGRHVHDLRRSAVRRLERAGVARSVAMKLTGHLTEAVYRRYAIVNERDLAEGVAKVATVLQQSKISG